MKNLLAICFIVLGTSVFAQKQAKLTVEWVYTGIIQNYDHNNRTEVFVDGVKVGTSSAKLQSKKNSIVVPVPQGSHKVRIVNFAEYEGKWEEHSRANDYSLDAMHEFTADFKKKKKVSLVFDITSETVKVK